MCTAEHTAVVSITDIETVMEDSYLEEDIFLEDFKMILEDFHGCQEEIDRWAQKSSHCIMLQLLKKKEKYI